jgi:hypothetical protein
MTKIDINSRNSKQAWTKQLSVLSWTPIKQDIPNTKKAVISYLEALPWTFYLTGGTRYELTLKSVRRLMERWYNKFKVDQSRLFWVAEKFECKDGYHGHGLLYLPEPERAVADLFKIDYFPGLIDQWQWATGNKDKDRSKWNALNLSHYDKKRGAGGYCAKYVFKDDADYDLLT